MTALSLIQQHCRVNALAIPSSVVTSLNTSVQQLFGLLNDVIEEMVTESNFNVTTLETVFTATAAEDQGAMQTLAPSGYQWAIFETFFDRTLMRPLYGPLDETEWQRIKALPNPGPFYKFRIRGDHLLMNPVPAAPLSTIAFEYVSSWAVLSSTGVAKPAITDDMDTFVFPENILKRGLAYRWKHAKGLPYQEDMTKFYELMTNYIAKDKVKRRINVAHPTPTDILPGVFIPSGNWNVH
jgi:hypothetical protein